ncbi:MAG: acetyl-CoA carboxylase biotin carboxyl carrier protein subunit [Oxalobacteraceae bacterium]|nr:MAG: acetyl-CoA carboxylase biotin carboxyl carrier protein subunit [Oxalobacteraceae bacterium]
MAEVKIKTEVAGRVCSILSEVGATIDNGDDIMFVEAMKMEIPVATTSAGKLKEVLVKVDDMIAEGQVVAIIES